MHVSVVLAVCLSSVTHLLYCIICLSKLRKISFLHDNVTVSTVLHRDEHGCMLRPIRDVLSHKL